MSTNLSKQKREDLLRKIGQVRSFLNKSIYDENVQSLTSYLDELITEINGQKYGLVFEEHKEAIDDMLEKHLPVFIDEKELFVDNGGEINFLLEGDNLASLQLLEKTHKGKIDVIYIDPPYNTGNKDFIYDDDFVDSADSFRHSKWLSFMEKRLRIARELLSEKGVIFISIDDNEQADLKLLCDEVFGENNFVSDIIWKHTQQSKNDERHFARMYNYTLAYAKNISQLKDFYLERTEEDNKNYSNPDNDPKGKWRSGDVRSPNLRKTLCFDIIAPNGNVISAPEKGWRWSEETIKEKIKTGEIIFKSDYSGIIRKIYLCNQSGRTPENIWLNSEAGTTRSATALLKDIFGGDTPFDTPKPIELIQRFLQLIGNNSATILDFFAGSGTTGHAVLKLNAEDGGHRKFILCTNNENGICRDITYQRLRTVITGKRKDGSVYSDGLSGSLKYFKVDFVEITEKEYYEYADKLLLHVRELVELENAVNFEGNSKISIILTEDELEDFCKNVVSTGASTIETLYLGHDVLLGKEQREVLKKKGISIKIIPQYYYPELNG